MAYYNISLALVGLKVLCIVYGVLSTISIIMLYYFNRKG